MTTTIEFISTHPEAQLPAYAHETGDAGLDLRACQETVLLPGTVTAVRTGLQLANVTVEEPRKTDVFLDIRSRSGLAKKLVFPVTGTVDASYRGEIFVVLANLSTEPYVIQPGDKIAQAVVQVIYAGTEAVQTRFTTTVQETERGSGGFGSTGR